MSLIPYIVYPPHIAIPYTASTSNSDPSDSFKSTMPQPATFDVMVLARLDDIVAYWKTPERPMEDRKDTAPIGNTTNYMSYSLSHT